MKFEDILNAANGIYQERGELGDITFNSLVRHIGLETTGSLSRLIAGRYKSEVKEINQEYDVKIPPIALLRAEVGNQDIEEHPLLIAKGVYNNFKIGMFDWAKFVTIPLEIDIKEAELLGLIWSDARKNDRQEETCKYIVLTLTGRRNDFEFYETFVAPRVKEVFNLPGEIKTVACTGIIDYKYKGKHYKNRSNHKAPVVRIGSTAVSTWLCEDMGFPSLETVLELLPLKRQKLAFMEGYIAGKGAPCSTGRNFKIDIYHKDKHTIDVVRDTLVNLDFEIKSLFKRVDKRDSPKYLPEENVRYYITLYRKAIDNLELLNPRHKKVLYG